MKKIFLLIISFICCTNIMVGQCCTCSVEIENFGGFPNAPIGGCNNVSASNFDMTAGSAYTFCYSFTTGADNYDNYMTVVVEMDLGSQTCEDNSDITVEVCQGATPVAVEGIEVTTGAITFNTNAANVYSMCVTLDPSDTDCSGNVKEVCMTATPSQTIPTPPVPCEPNGINPASVSSGGGCGSLVTIGANPIINCDGYTYEWTSDNPAFTTVTGTTSATDNGQITVSTAGTYTLTISDSSGNEVDSDALPNQVVVTNALPTFATISGYTTICSGETTTLTAGGGSDFAWTTSNGAIDGTSNTNEIEVSTSGTYQVEVTNGGNCPSTASVEVTVLLDACCDTNIYQQCVSNLEATIGLDRNEVYVSSAALQDVSQGYLHNFSAPPLPTIGTPSLSNLFVTANITNFNDDLTAVNNCSYDGTYINISQGCSAPFAGSTVNNSSLCTVIERLNTNGQCSIPTNTFGPIPSSTGTYTDDLIACNSSYSPMIDENTAISVDIIPAAFGNANCPYNNNAVEEGLMVLEYAICLEYVYHLDTDINITPDNPTSFCTGATLDLDENGVNGDATSNAWTSATPGVATVDDSGVVTGVSAGTAIITYTDENGCFATETVIIDDCCGGTIQFIKN